MQHVVFFKFDPKKFAEEFPGNSFHEVFEAMRKAGVPGLIDFNVGPRDLSPWEGYQDSTKGYTHVFVSTHTDANALRVFATHPNHRVVQLRVYKCLAEPPLRMEVALTSSKL